MTAPSGLDRGAQVTNAAFGGDQWCHDLGSTAATRTIGYGELDVGDSDDATVTLSPDGSECNVID
jgi:hypothetical protein